MSSFWKSIFSPIKKASSFLTNKLTNLVTGNWGQEKPKGTGVFRTIEDITKDLNTLEGKERRQLIDSLLDEFNIKDLRNTETDNVLRVLERKLKKEEGIPEANFNEQLFEEQDKKVYVGQNKSLKEIFENNPNAKVVIRLENGLEVTITKPRYDEIVAAQRLGTDVQGMSAYNDSDFENGTFNVLSIINPDLLDFTRIARKNEVGGIDDLRININEFENEDYYCPTNLSCIKKCIIKFLENKKDEETIEKLKTIDIPDVAKSNTINNILKENNFKYRIAFSYKRYRSFFKEEEIIPIALKEVELRGIGVGYSHAVLLKQKINLLYKSDKLFNQVKANKIELEEVQDFKKFKQYRYYEKENENGEIEQVPFFVPDFVEFQTNPLNLMTFDYECYQEKESKTIIKNGIFLEAENLVQKPYMVSYAYRKKDNTIKTGHFWDINDPIKCNKDFIEIIKKRIKELTQESVEKRKNDKDKNKHYSTTLTMVSHNGAGYDHHVFLRFIDDKNIKVKTYIGDESEIKSFEISFEDIKEKHTVRFIDSYLFTAKTLDQSCEAFGVEGKTNFDISNFLVKDKILQNKEQIITYGIQDSRCLLELSEKINEKAKEATGIDLSPFRYISLPSYASKIRDETSEINDIWFHKRREMVDFEQKAVFGGRLVVGSLINKNMFDELKENKEAEELIKKYNFKSIHDAINIKLGEFCILEKLSKKYNYVFEKIKEDKVGSKIIEKYNLENLLGMRNENVSEEDLEKWIKLCSKYGMRNPDINSLYPTAMANYEYPCGKSEIVRNKKKCKNLCKLFNKQKYEYMCIVKCKVRVNPKCIIPMIPNKLDDGSIDTTQKEFICVATNIEIQEAIKHGGYEVLEVYMYEEWTKKKYIFKNFIDKMYSKRLEYKKLQAEAKTKSEAKKYDILQEWCKLIMNASYGKIIQKPIDNKFKVTTTKEWTNELADQYTEYIQCINGKRNVLYKKKNKDVHDNKLPKYLGAFILSYSKKHMNDYISAVDGFNKPVIKYMDTDSLYFDNKYFKQLEEKGLIGPELGQATPDYDVDISEYVSLGKKIKFCKLTDGTLKTTFKGFSKLNKLNQEEKEKFFVELKEIANDEKLAEDCKFMKKSITRLNKKGLNIIVQELARKFKPTWCTHYNKIDGWLYPKYYEV